jgi:HTH-type transcriptional repressor of puuD
LTEKALMPFYVNYFVRRADGEHGQYIFQTYPNYRYHAASLSTRQAPDTDRHFCLSPLPEGSTAMSEASLAPGKRLSQIRQQLGLSQRRVAELSGLTHSAISTIEQDKVSPAISTLQKLLKVYGLSLSEFFAEPEAVDEPRVVIDAEDLIEIGSQGVSMKLVHNGSPTRNLAMMLETYQPGTTTGEKIKHQGEEIGTLLEGEIVLTINGQSYCLTAGQSYAINTGIPHSFSNTSARICRIVSAHTPTTF